MTDVHSKEIRSYNMSRIKSKNTKPEMLVRKFLHKNGFRFRLHKKDLPGKPDIVLPKYKTAILIHGCFWHGHENCKLYVVPKTKTEWWISKIQNNIRKDQINELKLSALGWKIIKIRECELKKSIMYNTLDKLIMTLQHE